MKKPILENEEELTDITNLIVRNLNAFLVLECKKFYESKIFNSQNFSIVLLNILMEFTTHNLVSFFKSSNLLPKVYENIIDETLAHIKEMVILNFNSETLQ